MSTGMEQCHICQKWCKLAAGGHTKHVKACQARIARLENEERTMDKMRQEQQAYHQRLRQEELNRQRANHTRDGGRTGDTTWTMEDEPMDFEPASSTWGEQQDTNSGPLSGRSTGADGVSVPGQEQPSTPREPSYIKTEYHPRTQLPPKMVNPDEERSQPIPPEPSLSAFSPFVTEADFITAERMTLSCASNEDINFFLKSHHDPRFTEPGATKLTFTSAKKMKECIDALVGTQNGFIPKTFEVPHTLKDGTKTTLSFTVWVKDPLPWIEELVRDPALRDHWLWYAFKQYLCHDGKEPERFITCPMSADYAMEIEATLPADLKHVQFPLIYYSDKSNAARFAQFSLWPVLLRPANLPKDFANQNSAYSGNTLFALIPKITAPAGDENNPRWAALSRKIYHKSCELVFESLSLASKIGKTMYCGDGIERTIYPLICIANLDFEEQCMCAAHQSTNATHPCPKCLVRNQDQSKLTVLNTARSHESSKAVIEEARSLLREGKKTQAANKMKTISLYMVDNAWWCLGRTDVHRALSFDVLHSIWLGVWGKHLLPVLLKLLAPDESSSQNNHYVAGERFDQVPTFPGMRRVPHFDKLDFADGKMFFSVLQQILPVVHDLLPNSYRPFLALIRKLGEIAMYAQFKMQTERRLREGDALVAKFDAQLVNVSRLIEKNFNFPKIHQLSHLFHDIRQKGTGDYLSCMIGENFHQGLIKAYGASNKRDAVYQILRNESRVLALSKVRWRANIFTLRRAALLLSEAGAGEEEEAGPDNDNDPPEEETEDIEKNTGPFDKINLGSPNRPKIRESRNSKWIETHGGYFEGDLGKPHSSNFHMELVAFLQSMKAKYQDYVKIPDLPRDHPMGLPIKVYHLIKHSYFSMDDCLQYRDLIHCNPSFHKRPRFDTVLIQVGNSFRPARLHLVFTVNAYKVHWQLARVTYFTELPSSAIDRDIGMRRYEEEPNGEFIHLASIIRSCYMSPIFADTQGRQFYLNDLAGGNVDLFLRVQPIA
ncbi:hypothetical protein M408DRAFT_29979 [Serendipita vermifera MAFF 305830]|uniref:Uncharacterized protein n=1 Tax=Serendipita vermifera MAFF 305830 TaxID=933852 RepID=A0A0C2WTW9_SERVB|nr:hypothetical protein M408DRAFT_29979 [Serendipita vermifera MAFF 305830]